MKAIVTATSQIKVQFYDLDPMNIVWHGNYARFFEIGRGALLDKIGYNYMAMKESGYAWPVIDMHIRYYRPLELRQTAEITAGITEWENRLKISYLISHMETGKKITSGHTVHVALDIQSQEMQWETPPVLREKLSPYLP
ncbi:acyl-CoA thioesterase [Parvibaculum sp.]|uniref:acyl-CoA thioesterase n=1 Tax=Parvibaculum sp. TaxID=2024848 RepID=UPI000C957A48|nr:acyl-CoA thioesterase [Parvibaculum sp.]MAB14649.1 4-hydroxybenzoyl-CoA thioesterase [Parvibaculum sp.]|tara:strand:+ start:60 stop:479 length:420 start_codon:yes stop_codon:yes gene_type:complete